MQSMGVEEHNDSPPPLYEVISLSSYPKRFVEVFILFLLIFLLGYRIISYDRNSGLVYLLSFTCEAWFSLVWFMVVSTKWTPVHYSTYPERLLQRFQDVPAVDVFVTTTDPKLEPPTITMNTVISFLASDYKPYKLAIYVSDQSASPITLFSLIQASEFAKQWIPFCNKYKIQSRAPFRYFGTSQAPWEQYKSPEFQQEWQEMKSKYDQLIFRVEEACKSETTLLASKEFDAFANSKHGCHDSIVKIIIRNEGDLNGLPNLIYVAREIKPEHKHHYKAGAINVLARVSGVMTNAPFMLNVDCDMFINNPQTFHHAMCLLLGSKTERECAFVQFPQVFYNGLKDDPFGNQLVVAHKKFVKGISGIQGPLYTGTGTFHRRKVIYGLPLDQVPNGIGPGYAYGRSNKFINSIEKIGSESARGSIFDTIEDAREVARCDYEYGTDWGVKVGLLYGSVAEDTLTGITIHSKGYKSMYCDPEQPSFMGCAPPSGPVTTAQVKRWTTGLLEIFFTKNNPIILSLTSNLHLRQSFAYAWVLVWGIRSIPETFYSFLPAYSIVSNSAFLPDVDRAAGVIPFLIFLMYYAYTLVEYLQCKLSFRAWWNNQRISRINSITAFLFGFIGITLKGLRVSETVFNVTSKSGADEHAEQNARRFTFDESLIYVPATVLVQVNLAALGLGFVKIIWTLAKGLSWRDIGFGPGELGCCLWLLLMFSPFVTGLFRKGKYGIPFVTVLKSLGFTLAFLSLVYCKS